MRSPIGITASVALLAVAGCSVPERDNPHDSANAPEARIVTKQIPSSFACAEANAAEATEEVHASRGVCLALDATSSADPQNDPLVDYEFSARQGTGATIVLGANSTGFYILSDEQRRVTLRPGTVTFSVRVEDRSGAFGKNARTFDLENSAPIPVTDPPRLLDRDVPWSTESCHPVVFDASRSADPDGDNAILHYEWTFTHGDGDDCPNAPPPDAATVTRLVKRDVDQRVTVTLAIDDTDLTSAPATTYVDVHRADTWIKSPYASNTVVRLDSTFEYLEGTGTGRKDVRVGAVAPDLLAIAYEGTSSSAAFLGLIVPEDPYTFLYGPIALPDDDVSIARDPLGNGSSVWTFDYSGGGTIRRYDLSGPAGAEATYSVPAGAVGDLPMLEVDATGSVWMTTLGGTSLVRVDRSTGAGAEIASNPQRVLMGIAVRPGTAELWAVEASNPSGGDGGASALVRFGATGEIARYDIELGLRMGIGFIGPDRAWIGAPGKLELFDVGLLAGGDDPVLLVVPLESDPGVLYADPVTKRCFATSFTGIDTTYEVFEDGFTIAHVDKGFAAFQESNGRIWVHAGDSLRGHTMSRTGIAATAVVGSTGAPRPDGAGGFWIESPSAGSVRHYDMRGNTTEVVSTAIDGAGGPPIVFPGTRTIYTSPDGGWLWTLSPGTPAEISRFDLSVRPPVRSLVVASSGAIESSVSNNVEPLLFISDPGASEQFAWVRSPQGISTISSAQTKTVRLTIPSGELGGVGGYPQGLAPVPGSNALCVAWQVPGASPIRVRMLAADHVDGSTPLLVSNFVVPAGLDILGIAGTHDDTEGDRCWLFYGKAAPAVHDCSTPTPSGELHARVFAPGNAVPVASFDDTDYGGSDFHAVTPREVWYTANRCDPTNTSLPIDDYVVRLDRTGATMRQILFKRPN